MRGRWVGAAAALAMLAAADAEAHFTTMIPRAAAFARGTEAVVDVFWGHPYEHVVFKTLPPEKLEAVDPRGRRAPLEAQPAGDALRFAYTPRRRGDHLLLLTGPRYWLEEERELVQDHVKLVLHVTTQEGWDRVAGERMEIVPLTRPYGLEAGFVFQGQVLYEGKPLAGAPVEIEQYLEKAPRPEDLPDDAMVTRAARTDPNGVVTFTLDEPGWWVIAASAPARTVLRNGKQVPLVERALFWVRVEPPFRQTAP